MAVQGTQYLAPTQSSLAKQRTADELPSPSKAPPPFSPSAVPGSPIAGAYEPLMQRVPSFAESLRCCQILHMFTTLVWLIGMLIDEVAQRALCYAWCCALMHNTLCITAYLTVAWCTLCHGTLCIMAYGIAARLVMIALFEIFKMHARC